MSMLIVIFFGLMVVYAVGKDIYDEWRAGLIDYHWSWPIMKHFVAKPDDVPTGDDAETADADAKAAMFIKARCEAGMLFARRLSDPNEDHAVQRAHYESVRDACIAELDLLDDEFYRGFAAHQIIDMCIAAGDIAVARTLLVSVTDDFLREKIFETAPALKV